MECRELAGVANASAAPSSLPVTWRWVDCSAFTAGDIFFHVLPGGTRGSKVGCMRERLGPSPHNHLPPCPLRSAGASRHWLGLTLSNTAEPVLALVFNDQDAEPADGTGRWGVYAAGAPLNLTLPLRLELLGASGARLTTRLDRLASQPLPGVQFPSANGGMAQSAA